MQHRLKSLIDSAIEYVRGHRFWGLREDELLQLLDFHGTRNDHLANPLNNSGEVTYFRPRETPLTGEDESLDPLVIPVRCQLRWKEC